MQHKYFRIGGTKSFMEQHSYKKILTTRVEDLSPGLSMEGGSYRFMGAHRYLIKQGQIGHAD